MPVRHHGRRQFLVGAGAVLAIPFLPSLAPRAAKAQASEHRFFVTYMTKHGGVWPWYMYPDEGTLSQSHQLYSDHTIRYGRLDGGSGLSTVMSTSLPQSLVDKMMVIQGLDIGFYIAHHSGGALGNFERRDGNKTGAGYVPTIDQVLAHSSNFYGAGDPYTMRSMHVGSRMSWVERSSGIQSVDPAGSPDVLFRTVLSGVSPNAPSSPSDPSSPSEPNSPTSPSSPSAPDSPMARTHVLNRVVEHYDSLVSGAFGDARQLSANDKARLSDHMDMVSDLARRLDTSSAKAAGVACDPQSGSTGNTSSNMNNPSAYSKLAEWHQDYNAVFAAAIACGASRVATVYVDNTFHDSSSFFENSQWHEPVAHRAEWTRDRWASQGNAPEHPQDTLVRSKKNFYRDGFVDMIERLDAIDAGDGSSLLDKGLVMWTQESGSQTHMSDGIPVVTAGSVNGYFNTGYYFDLRNRSSSSVPRGQKADNPELYATRKPGILYNQWLSNILQSMGMTPDQFRRSHPEGWAGYGHANIDSAEHHPQRLLNDANKKIAKVTSGT